MCHSWGVFAPQGMWGAGDALLAAARTHHGAHHPADVRRVIAAGAIPVLVPQVFGIYVQHVEANGQDVILELVESREERLSEVPPLSSLSGSLRWPCQQNCWVQGVTPPQGPLPGQHPLSDIPTVPTQPVELVGELLPMNWGWI